MTRLTSTAPEWTRSPRSAPDAVPGEIRIEGPNEEAVRRRHRRLPPVLIEPTIVERPRPRRPAPVDRRRAKRAQ